jgi:Uma2 family endonuclease
MNPARRRATYQDILDLPEHIVGEIVDGELYTSPRPASPHAHACSIIGGDLIGSFDGPPGDPEAPGGWWLLFEPELHLGGDVVVPDLAGWRRDRMPVMPNVPYFELAPDWVCEVVSPSTRTLDRGRKMEAYAGEAIPHLWLVDPLAKTLEVYRLEADRWIAGGNYAGNDCVHVEPFDAVGLNLQRWWLDD